MRGEEKDREGRKGKERERKKGGGEERIFCAKQPEWVRVPTSFWTQANDTYSKHHLSAFVFLNWKANSNISSVGCGGREKVGKEAATETSCPGISQTWSASSIRESSMPLRNRGSLRHTVGSTNMSLKTHSGKKES